MPPHPDGNREPERLEQPHESPGRRVARSAATPLRGGSRKGAPRRARRAAGQPDPARPRPAPADPKIAQLAREFLDAVRVDTRPFEPLPRDLRTLLQLLRKGALSYDGTPVTEIFVERLVKGVQDPDPKIALSYLQLCLGAEKPATEPQRGGGIQIVRLGEPRDPLAPPGARVPLRIMGEVGGPNGEIIHVPTGRVVVPAPKTGDSVGKPQAVEPVASADVPEDDWRGVGEDRLELLEEDSG